MSKYMRPQVQPKDIVLRNSAEFLAEATPVQNSVAHIIDENGQTTESTAPVLTFGGGRKVGRFILINGQIYTLAHHFWTDQWGTEHCDFRPSDERTMITFPYVVDMSYI